MERIGILRHERFPGIGMRITRLRRYRMAEYKGCPRYLWRASFVLTY